MAPVQRICRFYKAIQKRFSEMVGCGKFVTCRGTCPLVERSDIVTLETIGKLWEFVRSLRAALFRSWEFQLAAIDICGSFGEAGSSCRTKSAEPCIIGAAIFAGGLPGSTGRTVKILTQQTFVSTAVTAQGVKALRFQRQQTFVSTAVTAQGVKALTFQRPTFKKG